MPTKTELALFVQQSLHPKAKNLSVEHPAVIMRSRRHTKDELEHQYRLAVEANTSLKRPRETVNPPSPPAPQFLQERWDDVKAAIPQPMNQSQAALNDQLVTLAAVAVQVGLRDAADFIRRDILKQR